MSLSSEKTTQEKEKELSGKRYKIISISIQHRKDNGENVSHEMEIDLHHCWMITMKEFKESLGVKNEENSIK